MNAQEARLQAVEAAERRQELALLSRDPWLIERATIALEDVLTRTDAEWRWLLHHRVP